MIFLYSVDFQDVTTDEGKEKFWLSLGDAFPKSKTLPVQITDASTFQKAFKKELDLDNRWTHPVVLLFDEFDNLYPPEASEACSSCLKVIRGIKNSPNEYIIHSIIFIGTFGLIMMNQKNSNLSPFNTTVNVGSISFSQDQVDGLFKEYGKTRNITIDQQIVEDIYLRTSGYVNK